MFFKFCRGIIFTAALIAFSKVASAATIESLDLGPYEVIRPVNAIIFNSAGQKLAELPKSAMSGEGLSSVNPLHAVHSAEAGSMIETAFSAGEPITIQFDLGELYNLSELWLWQHNSIGELDRGMKDIEITFKDDKGNVTGSKISTGIQIGAGRPLAATYFCPFADCVRFIELRILGNHGDPRMVGISDIAFAGRMKTTSVPEFASISATAVALFVISDWYRRRR